MSDILNHAAPAALPEPAPPIVGFVEFANAYQLRGWAHAPDAPGQNLTVEAYVDDLLLASGLASMYREDLAEAGIDDGCHAFVLNFDVALPEQELADVVVYAFLPGGAHVALPNIAPPASSPEPLPREEKFAIPAPLPAFSATQYPVFILGAKRSGTSAVTQALLRSGRYAGQEEGHLLGLAGRLIALVEQYYEANETPVSAQRNSFITRVPAAYFVGAIKGVFAHLADSVFPSGYWIDKTPNAEMVRLVPLLKEIWPNAKFIFMKRRGIENLVSHSAEFPATMFRERCEEWRNVMEAWVRVRRALGADAIEVEQLELVREPEPLAARLAAFLDLPADEEKKFTDALLLDRPERTAKNFGQVYDLETAGWSASETKNFTEICGAMMAVFGYGYSTGYVS